MHLSRGWWEWVVVGALASSVQAAAVPAPTITAAPALATEYENWIKRQDPDAASFAQVLLTAIPLSLRQIAATNAPAVSSILWEEFLDGKKPQWFLNLPGDIQSYLIKEFGPKTIWYPPPPTTEMQVTPTASGWQWPLSSTQWKSPQTTPSAPIYRSTIRSSAVSESRFSSVIVSSKVSLTRSSQHSHSLSATVSASNSASASAEPESPPASDKGLTRRQKIGLGIGIPFGIFGAAAVFFGCCFLLRRRKRKQVNGSEPPSSPGFIPRFAFQDKSTDHLEHRRPLNPNVNPTSQDLRDVSWEDDGYDPYEAASFISAPINESHKANVFPLGTSPVSAPAPAPVPMTMHNSQPIMAPALYHTHSSNRARGRRTSYSSLHSVTEISEPDEEMESPVLGRQSTPLQKKRRPSLPMVLEMPPAPPTATVKRKPVPQSLSGISPVATASQSLLRPPMRPVEHSGSSSSGLAISTNSSSGIEYQTDATSPISPLSPHTVTNPFNNGYSYVEDYGPEYHNGYLDHEDGLYGGNRSLDRYPDPSLPRKSSKTEWPLRNMSVGHRRRQSPLWERVYDR